MALLWVGALPLLGWSLLGFFFFAGGYKNDTGLYGSHDLYFGDGMANFKLLILAAAAAFFTSSANAGYAQLSPPAGFSGSPGAWRYAAANASQFISNTVRTAASLSVGGVVVTVPVALRLAANASTYAARFAFANPLVITAAAVSVLAQAYVYWDAQNNAWVYDRPQYEFTKTQYKVDRVPDWFYSEQEACSASAAILGGYVVQIGNDRCYIKFKLTPSSLETISEERIYSRIKTDAIDPLPEPLAEPDFISKADSLITPSVLPEFIPNQPVPVADPVLNPSNDPIPLPQPYFYPLGDPIPVPNTNPQQWRTPAVQIVPSPTNTDPWRVDVQPKDVIKTDSSPITDSASDPASQTSQDRAPGLCEMYPDILACAKPKFDTPETDKIQTKDASISLTPDSGWGAENAVCPAPRHLSGANVDFDFTLMCQFMTGIRPVIIAIAWLSAAMILIGFKRGE